MKKWILFLLTALLLTACGNENVTQENSSQTDSTAVAENEADINTTDSIVTEEEITSEDQALYCYDSEEAHFEIVSVNPDAAEGYELKLFYENKLEDFKLNFALEEFAVQRYLSDTFVDYIREQNLGSLSTGTIYLDPQSTKEFSVYLDRNSLSELGITSVDEISFNFRVWNWDYIEEDVAYEEVAIYPTGLTKDVIEVPEIKQTETMKTVLENDHIRMICLGLTTSEDGELRAQYFVENKYDKYTTIELKGNNRSLKGHSYDVDWLYPFYLPGNTRCYVDIGFYHEEVSELADITSPEQISSFEATVTLSYYDTEMHEDEYRLVY